MSGNLGLRYACPKARVTSSVNGHELEPKALVTRAKAAKALYFMWVLVQPAKVEDDTLGKAAASK